MAGTQSKEYKNARREITKTLTRQGMFIAEYVQCKYKEIYKEAANMYNQLNNQYPCKPDLRKTTQFRDWKNTMAKAGGQSPNHIPREKKKRYIYKRTAYWNITLDNEQTKPSHTSDKVAETSQTSNPPAKVMCLNIPLLNASTYTATQQATTEEGDLQQATTEEGDLQQVTVEEEGDQTDMDMDPSILDGISRETMHKIIEELQADPNLRDIMNDIEHEIHASEDIEEEIVGLEVDLPELYDPLQEESIFW